jgi:hypothetical protein
MRRMTTVLTIVMTAALVAGVSAQGKPNFAGKWTMVADPNTPPPPPPGGGRGRGMMGGGWGQNLTITQDAKTLTVERTAGEASVKETYNLDGSDSRISMPGRQGGAPTEATAKANWEDNKLVIKSERTMNMGGNDMKIETKREITLDASGTMTVKTTISGMGNEPVVNTVTYKKG